MSGGKEFQSLGAEWLNAWLPVVLRRAQGTVRRIGGGGSEGTGWSDNMKEVRQIWQSEGMDGLKSKQKGVCR